MQTAQTSVALSPHRPSIASLFNLDDAAERYMAEIMQRFYCERPCLYTALAMKRVRNAQQERVVIEVVCFQPQRRQARARWMLIYWNIDDVCIRIQDQPSRQAAFTSYRAVADNRAPSISLS